MSVRTQAEAYTSFRPAIEASGKDFAKCVKIRTRPAVLGEEIITVTAAGVETKNIAKESDLVCENQTKAKEQYLLAADRVAKRYLNPVAVDGEFSTEWTPQGECRAVTYQGENFEFMAPWGEPMICHNGDSLVSPYEDNRLKEQVYRIAAQEFSESYAPKI